MASPSPTDAGADPATGSPEESEVIRKAAAGDHAAYEDLLERYEDRVLNFALRMCGNREDAEDIFQETFLTVFKSLPDFRGEGRLKSWIFKIASSHCLKKRRRRKGEPKHHIPVEEVTPEVLQPIAHGAPLGGIGVLPLEEVIREELSGKIRDAIEGLPPEYRAILLLRDVEGFSTTETAEMTDLSEAAVKSRLHRARIAVRSALQPYLEGRGT